MRLLLLFLILSFSSIAEDSLSVNQKDSIKPHSVRKAVILSTVVPGSGQIYNHIAMPKGKKKAYWKVPLIYAGLGATSYFLITNQVTQKELKNEYKNRQDASYVIPDKWSSYDDQGILTLYDQYLNWRDLSILGVAGVYLIQIVDAGVEAHFVNFDVSEDLSINISPTILPNFSGGISLRLNFR